MRNLNRLYIYFSPALALFCHSRRHRNTPVEERKRSTRDEMQACVPWSRVRVNRTSDVSSPTRQQRLAAFRIRGWFAPRRRLSRDTSVPSLSLSLLLFSYATRCSLPPLLSWSKTHPHRSRQTSLPRPGTQCDLRCVAAHLVLVLLVSRSFCENPNAFLISALNLWIPLYVTRLFRIVIRAILHVWQKTAVCVVSFTYVTMNSLLHFFSAFFSSHYFACFIE